MSGGAGLPWRQWQCTWLHKAVPAYSCARPKHSQAGLPWAWLLVLTRWAAERGISAASPRWRRAGLIGRGSWWWQSTPAASRSADPASRRSGTTEEMEKKVQRCGPFYRIQFRAEGQDSNATIGYWNGNTIGWGATTKRWLHSKCCYKAGTAMSLGDGQKGTWSLASISVRNCGSTGFSSLIGSWALGVVPAPPVGGVMATGVVLLPEADAGAAGTEDGVLKLSSETQVCCSHKVSMSVFVFLMRVNQNP